MRNILKKLGTSIFLIAVALSILQLIKMIGVLKYVSPIFKSGFSWIADLGFGSLSSFFGEYSLWIIASVIAVMAILVVFSEKLANHFRSDGATASGKDAKSGDKTSPTASTKMQNVFSGVLSVIAILFMVAVIYVVGAWALTPNWETVGSHRYTPDTLWMSTGPNGERAGTAEKYLGTYPAGTYMFPGGKEGYYQTWSSGRNSWVKAAGLYNPKLQSVAFFPNKPFGVIFLRIGNKYIFPGQPFTLTEESKIFVENNSTRDAENYQTSGSALVPIQKKYERG